MSVNAPAKLTLKDYKSDLHNDWCPGCVRPDTLILTPTGTRAIREIRTGDQVLGHDGGYHRVADVMSHWHPDTLQELTLDGLGTITITADHPVYLGGDDWRPAGELVPGDQVFRTCLSGRPELVGACAVGQFRDSTAASAAHATGSRLIFAPGPAGIRSIHVVARVTSNKVIPYNGFVYNLEVEDVHSYVTDVATLHNCGDFGILTGIQMALQQMQIDPDKLAVFSGIGCSGKTPHYINAYGFHTLHGRVLTVATGGRLANTGLTVLALGGDGDGYGIGAGYFVNSGRRNLDFTYLVHNNNVYGLTKGQASPTLSKGKKTKSMPEQAIQDDINPIAMAIASGYTFIARAYALEPKYLASIIVKAVQHKGSAVVDVLQTCPTYNDLYTKEWYEGADLPEKRSRLYKLEEKGYDGKVQDPNDQEEIIAKKAAAVARSYEKDPIPVGIYYEVDLPTYEEAVIGRIPALAEKPLVEVDVFHRDVTPLLEAMR
ncbi:MAG TPA: thiamine pyrophosphate-dependent enzyme [Candidatus Limnocylindria bacterium]|jgi:2-oxoglutarate ferredoxin oxidoreductase subunit beta|nr:thiamine pyrophosphate-dependent enzyme [Candidatus Limnocylindria bacterium]